MNLERDANELVAYSRAGDVFHYRWAARRCLRLIQSSTELESIIIEGSKEKGKAGEYVIDVAEYYDEEAKKRIQYFQLKHTTTQKNKPFTLSDLKGTIEGFSERYQQHAKEKSLKGVSFTIITNRPISNSFKENLAELIKGGTVKQQFSKTIGKYTQLDDTALVDFCKKLNLEDSEKDYKSQKEALRKEMARLQPGTVDPVQVDSIVSLVQEKVLPDSDGIITKEEILRPFGVTSVDQLFPAPPLFESVERVTIREQYHELLDTISNSHSPLIIHAEGGVGKSVFSQYLLKILPDGSLGIAYDCFGAGEYRRRSKPRHRHRDALVQISNELASKGVCERMLVKDTTLENDIMHQFMIRVKSSLQYLKQSNPEAQLLIIIDAADNAEMAAQEFGHSCFANEVMREEFPEDCRLILLCRPERTHLLKALEHIPRLSLLPFTKEETFKNLVEWYPAATENEAYEFHRLTSGNPRVQMNAIAQSHSSVSQLLSYLGPTGTTVDKQIEQQLDWAVQKIKSNLTSNYQSQINKICAGLASLPPNIPISVLAKASGVKVEHVKSFIADIGRSLWLLDSSVQFRDEPTETWFRKTYLSDKEDFGLYIKNLEPLASHSTYVAEVLPQLYLQAGQYDQLINIALSDQLLPLSNPIDKRNVLVYRLQFAFKAALISRNYKDSIKLALRAGEEVAGDKRQQELFQDNIDLLPQLQDKLKVQQIAFKGSLRSEWEGSENVYTASLLSEIEEYQGEATSYFRSAVNWLQMYLDRSKKKIDYTEADRELVSHEDILELATAQLNIGGAKMCLKFLNSLQPKEFIFQVIKGLACRLIDAGRFDELTDILERVRKDKYHVIAIVGELASVGRFPVSKNLDLCLKALSSPKTRIEKPRDPLNDDLTPAVVTFLEACLHRKLKAKTILQVLDYYVPTIPSQLVASWHSAKERITFLRAQSIRTLITIRDHFDLEEFVERVFQEKDEKKRYKAEDKRREFKEVIGGLLPWYLLRIKVISGELSDLDIAAKQTSESSRQIYSNRYSSHDFLPNEIANVTSSILTYCAEQKPEAVRNYFRDYLKDKAAFTIDQRIALIRTGHRARHLDDVIFELENSAYQFIKGLTDSRPEQISYQFVSLARAVLTGSKEDAAVYFEEAVNVVSKFGDEIVERWEALVALAKKTAKAGSDVLAYRFIRCAELVGGYVDREKHWDRSGALITCAGISPQVGMSALSRWRDREVGRFDYQLESLLIHLVSSKVIKPVEGWSMTRFLSGHSFSDFAKVCLSNESSSDTRTQLLDDACESISKQGTSAQHWREWQIIANQYGIRLEAIDRRVDYYNTRTIQQEPESSEVSVGEGTKNISDRWDWNFGSVDVSQPGGILILIEKFTTKLEENDIDNFWSPAELFLGAFNHIQADQVQDLIDALFSFEKINHYQCRQVLASIFGKWKNKVSFRKKWPYIINRFGRKYANKLLSSYIFRDSLEELDLDEDSLDQLRKGIFEGLIEGQEFNSSSLFFGSVSQTVAFVSADEARILLDYGLSRFEIHIDEDFGDGPWHEWLLVSDQMNQSLAGFIWSALGSPHSQTRWKACHVIRALADFSCSQVIDSLISWLDRDYVGAFGSKKFPFYELHARQYLLIALARVSIDYPELLMHHKSVFLKHSFEEPHLFIQKSSADIALRIEFAYPNTYERSDITLLEKIGKSELEAIERERGDLRNSYLPEQGAVGDAQGYVSAFDFKEYWYEPLGRVFGISADQVDELCADIVVNEWNLGTEFRYDSDPRRDLWNRPAGRETWYNKSDYPKTDTWHFYRSYHSMLSIASKLIKNMPVVSINDSWYDDSPWDDWLSRHILSRSDGKWLADCRGPVPLDRPKWTLREDKFEDWRTDFQDQDFLDAIIVPEGTESWLRIKGGWTERHNKRDESYYISAALVSKETSEALVRALETCRDSMDYKLPDYQEKRVEIDSGAFTLRGFIKSWESASGLDELDPFAANLQYPPISFAQSFMDELELKSDDDGETWYLSDGAVALKCETWSGDIDFYDKEPRQSGMRLSASLSLLQKLCKKHDSNLIIEVRIGRGIAYEHQPDNYRYLGPTHKIFLLTEHGRLTNRGQNIEFR